MSTAAELIISSKNFDASDIVYKPAKVMGTGGGKRVQFTINGKPPVISIPLMFTWGLNERVDENTGRVSYDTSIVFQNDKSKSIATFCDKLKELENKVLDDAAGDKCKEWFGKAKMSREVAEAMMYPVLKYPKNKETGEPDPTRDPNLKLKIPFWEDKFKVELYDMTGNPLYLPPKDNSPSPQGDKTPLDFVPSKSHIKGLISCDGIWMAGGRFGITWKLLQAQVRPPVNIVGTGVCHIAADSDDDEILGDIEKTEESKADTPAVNFSDGADDSDEEETAAPVEEAPKPKKKVVKRKKAVTAGAT